MTETQIEFFQRLCAPFEADELSFKREGGRVMTYVKPRRLQNRLDNVAGVDGWRPQYRRTPMGFTCRLHIRIPSSDDNERWVWFHKDDGAGTEGMMKKRGDEYLLDADNDEKSGYTNAFRRACAAWGISRYLYREGVPEYLGEAPEIPEPPPEFHQQGQSRRPPPQGQGGGQGHDRPAPRDQGQGQGRGRPSPQRHPGRGGGGSSGGDDRNFNVPRSGKALFAWAKGLEDHFGFAVVKPLNDMMRQGDYGDRMVELSGEDAEDLALQMIDEIKGWPNYSGEFDHVAGREGPRNP